MRGRSPRLLNLTAVLADAHVGNFIAKAAFPQVLAAPGSSPQMGSVGQDKLLEERPSLPEVLRFVMPRCTPASGTWLVPGGFWAGSSGRAYPSWGPPARKTPTRATHGQRRPPVTRRP